MTVSIFFVWVTDGEVEKKFPNGMFYTFRESYSVNSSLKSLNCTDSTGGWVKSWIEKVVDMHEASEGWGGRWGGECVYMCEHWSKSVMARRRWGPRLSAPLLSSETQSWWKQENLSMQQKPQRGLRDKQEEDEQSCSLAPNSSQQSGPCVHVGACLTPMCTGREC